MLFRSGFRVSETVLGQIWYRSGRPSLLVPSALVLLDFDIRGQNYDHFGQNCPGFGQSCPGFGQNSLFLSGFVVTAVVFVVADIHLLVESWSKLIYCVFDQH